MFKNRIKKIFYSISGSVMLFLAPIQAHAWSELITTPVTTIMMILVIGGLVIIFSNDLLSLSQVLLQWAANPNIAGGTTNNAWLMESWATVRDFANLFFILMMVAIGIGTALRIKSYEIKKTLPRLIAIAVLINFSPMICGVVIDASNIAMNFFNTQGGAGFELIQESADSATEEFSGDATNAVSNAGETAEGSILFRLLTGTIFNLFTAFIMLMMTGLLLVRHVALWVLVILSPLAFLGAIFEKGGKDAKKLSMFQQWKSQFFQWTFIGVTASFFIYLAKLLASEGAPQLISSPATGDSNAGNSTINSLIIMSIPSILLYIGFKTAIKSGAMGANFVTGKLTGWAGKINPMTKTGRETLGRLRTGIGNQVYKRSSKVQEMAKRVAMKTPDSRAQEYADAGFIKKVGMNISRGAIPYKQRERFAARVIENSGQEARAKKVKERKAETDKMETKEGLKSKLNTSRGNGDAEGVIASVQTAAEKGWINDLGDSEIIFAIEEAAKINKKTATDIMETVPEIAQGMYEKMREAYVGYNEAATEAMLAGNDTLARESQESADQLQSVMEARGLWMTAEEIQKHGNMEGKILHTMKKKNVAKLDKDYIKTPEVQRIIQDVDHGGQSAWSGDNLAAMADEFGIDSVNMYNQVSQEIHVTDPNFFENSNPARKWITDSPGAFAAGFRDPRPPTPEDPDPDEDPFH